MKKNLTFQFIMVVMLVCQAQVGINTENPHGVLDVQNEPNQNFGMVVPTVESLEEVSTPDGTDVLNGTIVHDASRDALCVKLVKGWSCFDGGTDPVDPNDPTDPSDPSNPSDSLPDFTNATQEAYVKPFNTKEDDYFGYSVAISADGNTLAVGAYAKDSGFDNDAGAVYVFFRSDNEWVQQAYIQASN